MENKVWVLIHEWAYDGENDITVEVFGDPDRAKQTLKIIVDNYKAEDSLFNGDVPAVVEDDRDDYFVAYEDGDYCSNHILISIVEREVR